jgi:hypothetical protein
MSSSLYDLISLGYIYLSKFRDLPSAFIFPDSESHNAKLGAEIIPLQGHENLKSGE